MPWPACTSGCRPPIGCEHRWESCMGLAGGALCHSKRFLGSGDRCPPSWHAAGAGVALSRGLLASVKTGPYTECAVNITKVRRLGNYRQWVCWCFARCIQRELQQPCQPPGSLVGIGLLIKRQQHVTASSACDSGMLCMAVLYQD